MPHNVISDALNILESRPREGLISFFLRRYALIQGLSITALLSALLRRCYETNVVPTPNRSG